MVTPQRIDIRSSVENWIFSAFFFLLAISLIAWTFPAIDSLLNVMFISGIFTTMLFVGAVLNGAGIFMLYLTAIRIVFDEQQRYVLKGIREPREAFQGDSIKCLATVEDIHALQLISEYHGSSSDMVGFRSYKLNLVLKDGKRVNIICHGSLNFSENLCGMQHES